VANNPTNSVRECVDMREGGSSYQQCVVSVLIIAESARMRKWSQAL